MNLQQFAACGRHVCADGHSSHDWRPVRSRSTAKHSPTQSDLFSFISRLQPSSIILFVMEQTNDLNPPPAAPEKRKRGRPRTKPIPPPKPKRRPGRPRKTGYRGTNQGGRGDPAPSQSLVPTNLAPQPAPEPVDEGGADEAIASPDPFASPPPAAVPTSAQVISSSGSTDATDEPGEEEEDDDDDNDEDEAGFQPPSDDAFAGTSTPLPLRTEPEESAVPRNRRRLTEEPESPTSKRRRLSDNRFLHPADIEREEWLVRSFQESRMSCESHRYRELLPQMDNGMEEAWWQDSLCKLACDEVDPVTHPELLFLWKVCLQIYGCAPAAIVTPVFRLLRPTNQVVEASKLREWSGDFCTALAKIIMHPVWRGLGDMITFFLFCAVAIRTDDRDPVNISCGTSCSIMLCLGSALEEDHDNVNSMHLKIREEVAAEIKSEGTSLESSLLMLLGRIVLDPRNPKSKSPTLCVEDLNNVLTAINESSSFGFFFNPHADAVYDLYLRVAPSDAAPNPADLRALQTESLRREYLQQALEAAERWADIPMRSPDLSLSPAPEGNGLSGATEEAQPPGPVQVVSDTGCQDASASPTLPTLPSNPRSTSGHVLPPGWPASSSLPSWLGLNWGVPSFPSLPLVQPGVGQKPQAFGAAGPGPIRGGTPSSQWSRTIRKMDPTPESERRLVIDSQPAVGLWAAASRPPIDSRPAVGLWTAAPQLAVDPRPTVESQPPVDSQPAEELDDLMPGARVRSREPTPRARSSSGDDSWFSSPAGQGSQLDPDEHSSVVSAVQPVLHLDFMPSSRRGPVPQTYEPNTRYGGSWPGFRGVTRQ
ncbi:hypothetical protein HJFPF1_02373 [Paramyrothecium foliicola]|nr:hypothetical protein HJFPF1_02373 [Paramyrothecium foliicola]